MTYAELDARANQLAHHLQRLGVGPDSIVGLCVNRSPAMLVGLLGILKAGGAYVPLDPAYPAERLAFMLADSGAQVVLTEQAIAALLPSAGVRVIRLDVDWPEIARESVLAPACRVAPDNLAYVIYTSGSTGRPKGVAMPHRPLVNLLRWQHARSGADTRARTLQFASLSFDVSFQESFATWLTGATLVLVADEVRRDAAELLRLINEARVERLLLPFVALQHLAEISARAGIFPATLTQVITAGEQLKITPYVRAFFQQLAGCTLDNQYGPSETHVVSAHALDGAAAEWPELPPIGRPIANATMYVLDQELQPAPIGIAGELYLGGVSLARGYLHRPDLTAERFVPDPFSAAPGARLYRTGDLARWRADGSIEYLGRIDSQVKIRGFRIELGEIEAVLAEHAAVAECVVVARGEAAENRQLVAYVVAAERAPDTAELRQHLGARLPEYMLPSTFVLLTALPLTPSGKVDRQRLPAPASAAAASGTAYIAPRTPIEEVLAGCYAAVLALPRVSTTDNFFNLGGHSLLATQLLARIRQACRVELPLRALFAQPTVAALAEVVETELRQGTTKLAPPLLPPPPRPEVLPLSFAQQRLWFIAQLRPASVDYNLPVALRLAGTLDRQALTAALHEVVRRHEVLRTTF
ncbi:MAG TPA: amino acid adenylation domain-containing protein, partial [Pyrinomonadaceae bacterium]|nr:amino acid adenylation domain-containing protein [Pyrinomonadaceae bacterium]